MKDELVTLATFPNSIEANLAKDALAAEGIHAYVDGDDAGSVLGMMTSSLGLRLRIRREDLKAARQVLGEIEPVDVPDDAVGEAFVDVNESPATPDDPDRLTRREEDADRAFRSAIIGFFFCPLQVYTLWLLARVYFSDERLGPKQRRRTWIAVAVAVPYLLIFLSFVKVLFFSG